MLTYLLAVAIVLIVLAGWVAVQQMARRFALRHPELGPFNDKAGSCGGCGCGGTSCENAAEDGGERGNAAFR